MTIRSLTLGVLLLLAPLCGAATLTQTLADYDGPVNSSGFPIDLGVVNSFNYVLPGGAVITSASFSGTYGTAQFSTSTAGFDVVIGGQTINVCIPNDPGCWGGGPALRPFSFNLNAGTFAALLTGNVGLQVIQTNQSVVRLGSPTLTIDYRVPGGQVPEPATAGLLGLGLAAGAVVLRRRARV